MRYEFQGFYIPERMMGGIQRYLEHGIPPGSFLTAIIENNLSRAVANADNENMQNIPAYVSYFYNECPGDCWGSPENMQEWMKNKQEEATDDRKKR